MKVLVCAYREWALSTYRSIIECAPHVHFEVVQDPTTMERLSRNDTWDLIVLIGWSWKVPADIVRQTLVVGMHPSELPKYAGGTPIQHQILDGLQTSYATLFKLNEKFDAGEILDKAPYSLTGHLDEVFSSLSKATVDLVIDAINRHPNHVLRPQGPDGFVRRRLTPDQSRLMPSDIQRMTCKQIFDFIRCREDPYPNVFLEDETGRLVIKRVEFEPF